MKRIVFFTILLCSVILTLCNASAEKGYITIQNAITQSIGDGQTFEFSEFTTETLPDEKAVTLLFYPWKNEISLWGKNEDNQGEVTLWNTELCVLVLGGYCGSWDALCDSLEHEYYLNIILQANEGEEFLLIDSAEKAATMHQAILKEME
ncbi:MAG: hypothetical protein J6K32_10395 [Clostridia bacterium]|nr:hypothetical protein [Clostridia bacterium]